jgi:hypothetical protein
MKKLANDQQGMTIRFSELLEKRLNDVISRKYCYEALTPAALKGIRDTIREVVISIFNKSSYNPSYEMMGWIANQYFRRIQINGSQSMDELVIINEFKLSEMSTFDISLLRSLFSGTTIGSDIELEVERRGMLS